jgi:hypothetical protein
MRLAAGLRAVTPWRGIVVNTLDVVRVLVVAIRASASKRAWGNAVVHEGQYFTDIRHDALTS